MRRVLALSLLALAAASAFALDGPMSISNPASSGSSLPDPVTVAHGGTGLATLTPYYLMAAGTTSTGNLQQISVGTAGQVLTSNGAGALPSFQAASGGISGLTTGRVPYAASSTTLADSANLAWNNTNGTLVLSGTDPSSSTYSLYAERSVNGVHQWRLRNTNSGSSAQGYMGFTSDVGAIYFGAYSSTFSEGVDGFEGAGKGFIYGSSPNGTAIGAYDGSGGSGGELRFYTGTAGYSTLTKRGSFSSSGSFSVVNLVSCSSGIDTNGSGVMSCHVSDATLKDIALDPVPGLDALMQIHPVAYTWKPGTKQADGDTSIHYGFTAQDVAAAMPAAVKTPAQGPLILEDRAIVAALVKSVQELNARVGALEAAR